MAAVRQDIGYALRTLGNQPGFAAVAVLTLALGIGANIAIFSLVHAVMWKPLPFDDPAQLMLVHMLRPDPDAPGTYVQARWSYPKYQVFKDSQQVFESTAIVLEAEWNLTGVGSPIRVPGERVDSSYFQVLGARPQLGRVFDAAETASPASSPIAVISDGLWRRRFGADGGVVGKTLDLGGIPHTILGVLPPRFHGFTGQADVWVPVTTQPAKILLEPWSHNYRLVARRKHGVPVDQVRAALEMASAAVDRAFPARPMTFGGVWRLEAVALDDERIDPLLRRSAQLLLAAVVAVLLIVCVNLANLTLVRGLGRQRETAIRLALGASRLRIVRQLMTESAVLAAAGAACGLAVAYSVMVGAAALMPDLRMVLRGPTAGLTRVGLSMLGFDFRTAIFACACAVGTAVLFGGVPAWRASRRDVAAIMKEGAAGAIGMSARTSSGRNLLMAGELALALMLLVAAGLMLKSTFRLHAAPLGIRPDALVTFRVSFPSPEYTAATATARLEQLLDRLRARGDVESAAYGNCAPVSGGCSATIASFPDRPPAPPGHETLVGVYWADPAFFQTLGIPLRQGRVFANRDRVEQPKVAIVNEAAARAFWPNQNPLGKRVGLGMGGFVDGAEVVGVVGDVRYGTIETAVRPDIYIPLFQSPSSGGLVFVRSRSTLDTMASTIRAEVEAIDRNLPIVDLKTMDERLGDATWRTRMSAWLLGTFAALALLLGGVGVYGVMSQGVEQRRREIGVRMALGAGHAEIARMILGRGVRISVGGVVLGLALAIPASRLLTALLYDVTPGDPLVLATLASLLVCVALMASYIPARRATRVDPLTTLRAE